MEPWGKELYLLMNPSKRVIKETGFVLFFVGT